MRGVRRITYTALFTALIAAGAFVRIPLPTAPLTLQLQFTNLAGLLLGKKYGAAAALAYMLAGLAGIPVFAGGGGIGYVLRPTFGYLAGFVAGAYAAGAISERKKTFKAFALASVANILIVYAIGAAYYFFISKYYLAAPIGIGALFLYNFALPAPGDFILCLLSARVSMRLLPVIKLD